MQKEMEEATYRMTKKSVAKKYSEQEVLPTMDKDGKPIKRPTIVFISKEGGGDQKVWQIWYYNMIFFFKLLHSHY
jgi:ADP-heptose:LPS heptosyltransferase